MPLTVRGSGSRFSTSRYASDQRRERLRAAASQSVRQQPAVEHPVEQRGRRRRRRWSARPARRRRGRASARTARRLPRRVVGASPSNSARERRQLVVRRASASSCSTTRVTPNQLRGSADCSSRQRRPRPTRGGKFGLLRLGRELEVDAAVACIVGAVGEASPTAGRRRRGSRLLLAEEGVVVRPCGAPPNSPPAARS